MLLLAGLGNPGRQYAQNRHNIGFMAADEIARRHGFGPWRGKFQAEVADGTLGGVKVLLMKPTTFMNESGRAVGEAMRFYKLEPADVLVMHDELDLAPGKFRLKVGGGHGGNNGIRSISNHIGAEFRRLRIGIGHPGRKDLVHRYVLHDFAKADAEWVEPLLDAFADNADLLAKGQDSSFANKVHLAIRPPQDQKPPKAAGKDKSADTSEAGKSQPDSGGAEPTSARKGPMAEGLARLLGLKRN